MSLDYKFKYYSLNNCLLCGNDKQRKINTSADIVKCVKCSFVFVNPRPTQESILVSYSQGQTFNDWMNEFSHREKMWERRFKTICKWINPGKALDIGAGIGTFVALLKAKGYEAQGNEPSIKAIEIANEKYNLNLINSSFEDSTIYEKYDNVFLWHVLEHFQDPSLAIKKISQITDEKGRLFIAVPNASNYILNIENFIKRILNCSYFFKYKYLKRYEKLMPGKEIHLSHFTKHSLLNLLKKYSYKIIYYNLDYYYPIATIREKVFYALCKCIFLITGINIFHTMIVIAEKEHSTDIS